MIYKLIVLTSAIFLFACGGGGGSSVVISSANDATTTPPVTSVEPSSLFIVGPKRLVANTLYSYKGTTVNSTPTQYSWSWGDASDNTTGASVKKVWNRAGGFTTILSALVGSTVLVSTQSAVVVAEPISAGGSHTCAIKADATVACWGANNYGQLGNGNFDNQLIPTPVYGLQDVVALNAGSEHTCAIDTKGDIFCWGNNQSGQLGNGSRTNTAFPLKISGLTKVAAISVGGNHTCAIKQDATVTCWGDNDRGQLGSGFYGGSLNPSTVKKLSKIVAINTGLTASCAIDSAGSVFCWGAEKQFITGRVTGPFPVEPARVIRLEPTLINGVKNAVALSSSANETCAVLLDGRVSCWPHNYDALNAYVPTVKSDLSDVAALSSGTSHFCALKSFGNVVCWGSNVYGQLGAGMQAPALTPVDVVGLSNVTAITAGDYHTCALKVDGQSFCWCLRASGQIGDAVVIDIYGKGIPGALEISTGTEHACARKSDGSVQCWGDGAYGSLGTPLPIGEVYGNYLRPYSPDPVAVSGLSNVVALSTRDKTTCALQSDGGVVCWGGRDFQRDLLPRKIQTIVGSRDLNAEGCVVKSSGSVDCWTNNGYGGSFRRYDGFFHTYSLRDVNYGQYPFCINTVAQANLICNDEVSDVSSPAVVSQLTNIVGLSSGEGPLCFIRLDGSVICSKTSSSAATVTYTSVPGLSNATSVFSGVYHSCAVKTDATVVCWGRNASGQLGDGTGVDSSSPVAVRGINGALAVSGGENHTCAIKSDGTVLCWGFNYLGQLGSSGGTYELSPVVIYGVTGAKSISSAGNMNCVLSANDSVACWGDTRLKTSQVVRDVQLSPSLVNRGVLFWR